MKFKLLDVETNPTEEETGTCELCFSTTLADNPVYIVEIDGKIHNIAGYEWNWDDYDEYLVDNVIEFASYLSEHEFEYNWDENDGPEMLFYSILVDYCYHGRAEQYEK